MKLKSIFMSKRNIISKYETLRNLAEAKSGDLVLPQRFTFWTHPTLLALSRQTCVCWPPRDQTFDTAWAHWSVISRDQECVCFAARFSRTRIWRITVACSLCTLKNQHLWECWSPQKAQGFSMFAGVWPITTISTNYTQIKLNTSLQTA